MADTDKYQNIFENWRKYLKEYEDEPEDEDHEGSGKYYVKNSLVDPTRQVDDPLTPTTLGIIGGAAGVEAASKLGGVAATAGKILGGGWLAKKLLGFGGAKVAKETTKTGILAGLRKLGVRGVLGKVLTRGIPFVGTAMLAYEVVNYFMPDDASEEEKKKKAKELQNDPSFLETFKKHATDWYDENFSSKTIQTGPIQATADDEEALLRMLYAETGWNRSEKEMAAIIQVAINRKLLKSSP